MINSLFSLIQFMAGVNFAPSFVKKMLEVYYEILDNMSKKQYEYISQKFNNIEKKLDKKLDKKLKLEKLLSSKQFLIEIQIDMILSYSEILYNDLDKRIKDEFKQKIPSSFIMSGIFCLNFLIFIPIFDVYLNNVNPVIVLKLFFFWSIILHFIFQLVLNNSVNSCSNIILKYIIFSVILSFLLIISLNGLIPPFININFDYFSLKLLIPLLILSSFFTFLFFPLKFYTLSYIIQNKVRKKSKKIINEMNEIKNNVANKV